MPEALYHISEESDIAAAKGATVYLFRFKNASAADYARAKDALLAGSRTNPQIKYSLSPASLQNEAYKDQHPKDAR